MREQVKHLGAKRRLFFSAMADIDMSVQIRIEGRRTFQYIAYIIAFSAFFTSLKINEIHVSTKGSKYDLLIVKVAACRIRLELFNDTVGPIHI